MELWIRSQDKGALIKVEILGITDGTIHSYSGNNKIILGEYSSTERALEVLDEIQKLIQPIFITTGYDCKCKENPFDKLGFNLSMTPTKTEIKELSTYVYEMPKE